MELQNSVKLIHYALLGALIFGVLAQFFSRDKNDGGRAYIFGMATIGAALFNCYEVMYGTFKLYVISYIALTVIIILNVLTVNCVWSTLPGILAIISGLAYMYYFGKFEDSDVYKNIFGADKQKSRKKASKPGV